MIDTNVLVLNKFYQAIQIVSVRKAFTLFYKGLVRAVAEDFCTYNFDAWCSLTVEPEDDVIHTPSIAIRIPRVILLINFDRVPKKEVKFNRRNIFLRDKNMCQYCGERFPTHELSLDHVIPVSRGGQTVWENVVCCCVECNKRKGDRTPQNAGLRLVKIPARPRWHPLFQVKPLVRKYEEWGHFLDIAYWNTELTFSDGSSSAS
jgi:5-methylcytosine-specific restriction endonuclease McrA